MPGATVLVIGGSRGIGRATVLALVREGATVAFTWHQAEDAATTLVEATEGRTHAFRFDVRDRGAAAPLVEAAEAAAGPLTGLVYCAGARRDGLLALTTDDEWDAVLDTNLAGAFRVCRAVVPGMLRRRGGSIVAVSSLSAYRGIAGQALYAASKAGLIALSRALARECGRRGVRVNTVVPGYVPTDFVADLPDRAVEALRASECLTAGTSADAVADAIVFLLSERASSITGQALVVDSGASA